MLPFCVGFCRVFVDIMVGDLDVSFCGEFQVGEYHRKTPELGFLSFWNEYFCFSIPLEKNHWDRKRFCVKDYTKVSDFQDDEADFLGDGWTCLGPSYWSGGWNQTSEGVGPGLKDLNADVGKTLGDFDGFVAKQHQTKRESCPVEVHDLKILKKSRFSQKPRPYSEQCLRWKWVLDFELSSMSSHLVFVESFKCRIWVNHRDVTRPHRKRYFRRCFFQFQVCETLPFTKHQTFVI